MSRIFVKKTFFATIIEAIEGHNMKKEELFSKILGCGVTTYYNWKREDNRPILKLIERYFTDEDIEEFLEKKAIGKWEFLKHSYNREMNENIIAFKNILDDIGMLLIGKDDKNLDDVSILFLKTILYLSTEANPSRFYNISELIMIYAKKKEGELSDSIIELNKIVSSRVHNKSFIPFLYQLGRNDLMDLFNDKPFEFKKYDIEHYFIQYIFPYWNLKYTPNDHEELQQTGYHQSQNIFNIIFREYNSEDNYTKREMIKMFKDYYQKIKEKNE